MSYIELKLKKINTEYSENQIYTFPDLVKTNGLIVLLGSPGSGKTKILENYSESHSSNTQLLTVKKFLKLKTETKQETKILLLDGLDEYRSTSNDKDFVTVELGSRIHEITSDLPNLTIVISCREMDWYGEEDTISLQNEVKETAKVYKILPFDEKQQLEMAKTENIENPEEFIDKYSDFGFLSNPQMFKMTADIYKDNSTEVPKSKKELYYTFIKKSREKNPAYLMNKKGDIDQPSILKYGGYIALFYIFSDIDFSDPDLLDKITDEAAGYPKDKLEIILKHTKLFLGDQFSHRTIAEFLAAHFIKSEILNKKQDNQISLGRVKTLFVNNSHCIPTQLRGTYSWLCSLTENPELIAEDPYYQAILGDNTLFNLELKKQIILKVKDYFKENPYSPLTTSRNGLDGFYDKALDDILIEEFKTALTLNNHFIYFICNIISSGQNLSEKICSFIKKQMLDNSIPTYYKESLINVFKNDPDFLVNLAKRIKDHEIIDKDRQLLSSLLYNLYPDTIPPEELVDYLFLFKDESNENWQQCYFLFATPNDKKYQLVDVIHKINFDSLNKEINIPNSMKSFVEDYFLETILQYDEEKSAKEIYEIIIHFKQYYQSHNTIKFFSYRNILREKQENNYDKLKNLANEMFNLYVEDIISTVSSCNTNYPTSLYFVNLVNSDSLRPNNAISTLLGKINKQNSIQLNTFLFKAALNYSMKLNIDKDLFYSIAKDYGFEVILDDYQNPPKSEREIEHEKREAERKTEIQKLIDHNETYFKNRDDKTIQQSYGDLYFICDLVYFFNSREWKQCLSYETFKRLKKILKESLFSENLINPKSLTLESLVQNPLNSRSKINKIYYTACCLNNWENIKFQNNEFYRYLYILSLLNEEAGYLVRNSNLTRHVNKKNKDLAINIIKKYHSILFGKYLPTVSGLVSRYLALENNIEKLTSLLPRFISDNSTACEKLLYPFLKNYNFNIETSDLESLLSASESEKCKLAAEALLAIKNNNKVKFDINMAVSIFSLLSISYFNYESFTKLKRGLKIKLIDFMFSQFNTYESIKFVSRIHSQKQICASFLQSQALKLLTVEELEELNQIRNAEEDIWTNYIKNELRKKEQQDTDSKHLSITTEKLKNFIFAGDIITPNDFFNDIIAKLEILKKDIEANRNNDKSLFYNDKRIPKNEEACRDIIFIRLKDRYGYDLSLTREQYEANKRVDLNIKYKAKEEFEIQIECKKDNHPNIKHGISQQLIPLYLEGKVEYGIYLIFYFGDKKDLSKLLDDVDKDIPDNYKERIKVLSILKSREL